ncbi:hypothetical protein MHY85_19715 [Cellulomonas sp. ACRRI]|uniref:hypothetical protein n=1 Tax=Cellulomonas sp. ACRRI TaxID=2918188 RepID=UPI001EF2ADBE|nr:hypothetical protein [Cellulomonas sp. ACRRI]MCG7288187.1 hypothetical protein [Cellulomonas sp. ACRRI]
MTQPYGQDPHRTTASTPPAQAPAGPAGYGAPAPAGTGTPVLSIITFVLSAIAILFLPIVFGLAGIVTGIVAVVRKERLGKIALIVAVVATVIGFALGALVMSQMS